MNDQRRRLLLFVAGDEPNSMRAQANLAESEAAADFDLEVVDVLEDFERALSHSILVTPALLVEQREGKVMIVGDLSDRERLHEVLAVSGEDVYEPEHG